MDNWLELNYARDMLEILDHQEIRQRMHRLSVRFYNQLGEMGLLPKQTELIRGYLIHKMSKSPLHLGITLQLYNWFLKNLPSGFTPRIEGPLTLKDSVPEPDVSVVKGDARDYWSEHPKTSELVVEVAVSSLTQDREMAAIYAEADVAEFWIVMAAGREVEVYRKPTPLGFTERRIYCVGEVIRCESLPGIEIPVAQLFSMP